MASPLPLPPPPPTPFPHPPSPANSKLPRLPLQPRPRPLVAVEERFRLVPDLEVVGVDPGALERGEEVEAEEAAAEGHHGDVLEAEVGFVAEGVGGGDFARHDDV